MNRVEGCVSGVRASDCFACFDTIGRSRWGTLRKRRFTRRSVDLSQRTTQMWPEHVPITFSYPFCMYVSEYTMNYINRRYNKTRLLNCFNFQRRWSICCWTTEFITNESHRIHNWYEKIYPLLLSYKNNKITKTVLDYLFVVLTGVITVISYL